MQRRSSRVFSAYVPGRGGRERKRETVFAATYDDAVRLWTAFRERVKNRHVRPAVAPFFSDYIADYFDDIAAQVSGVTARDYRYAIDKHLLPFFGNRRLNEISTAVVKSFQTKLNRSGYALATVNDTSRYAEGRSPFQHGRDHFHRSPGFLT